MQGRQQIVGAAVVVVEQCNSEVEDDGDFLLEVSRRHQARCNQFDREFVNAVAAGVLDQQRHLILAYAADGFDIAKDAFDFDDGAQQRLLYHLLRIALAQEGQVADIDQDHG